MKKNVNLKSMKAGIAIGLVFLISFPVLNVNGSLDSLTVSIDNDIYQNIYDARGSPVSFQGQASGGTADYHFRWDFQFGDDSNPRIVEQIGSFSTSTSHVYYNVGIYSVSLSAIDSASPAQSGSDQATVWITEGNFLSASPSPSSYQGIAGQPISFTGSAYGGIPTYYHRWRFGDGLSTSWLGPYQSNEQHTVTHTYQNANSYTAYLDVKDARNREDAYGMATAQVAVNVNPPDTTGPTTPVISSSTHSMNQWSNNNNPVFTWTAAIDPSGIAGYYTSFDHDSSTNPNRIINTNSNIQSKSYTNQGDGIWFFHVAARDNADAHNWGAEAIYGPILIDTVSPSAPSVTSPTHFLNQWSVNNNPSFSWTSQDNAGGSGLAGYDYIFDHTVSSPLTGSPVSDTSHTYLNTADGTWYLHIRAKDNADNWGPISDYGPIGIDVAAPSTPLISSSHVTWIYSSNNDLVFSWSSQDNGGSGIAGYDFILDNSEFSQLTGSAMDVTSQTYNNIADGQWFFHVRVKDNVEHWSVGDFGPIFIDTVVPSAPIVTSPTHIIEQLSNNNNPTFSWTCHDNADGSGIGGYSYILDHSAFTTPDLILEPTGTSRSVTCQGISDGTWYFHVRAADNSNPHNWGAASHFGPILIDTVAPSTPQISSPHEIGVSTTDNDPVFFFPSLDNVGGSGIEGYSYVLDHSETTIPAAFVSDADIIKIYSNVADGVWYFHVRARDNARNWGPTGHYGPIIIDTTAPSFTWISQPTRGTTGETVTVRISTTDNIGVTDHFITVNDNIYQMTNIDDTYSYTIHIPNRSLSDISYSCHFGDAAGNDINTDLVTINIFDNDPPFIQASRNQNILTLAVTDNIEVAYTIYRIDTLVHHGPHDQDIWAEGSDIEYTGSIQFPQGIYRVNYYSVDSSGNLARGQISFTIYVQIISPNGGEILSQGPQVIQWYCTAGRSADISISYDSGLHWSTLATKVPLIQGLNSYTCQMQRPPLSTQVSRFLHCRIQVDIYGIDHVVQSDISDSDFTIL
jgi:hypothetical protein